MMRQPGARFQGRLGSPDIHVPEDLQGVRVYYLESLVEQGEKKVGFSNGRGAEDNDYGRALGVREYAFGANAVLACRWAFRRRGAYI
jgi:hypothetical protein